MIAIAMEKWLYNGCTRHAHSVLSCMSSNMAQFTLETKFREKLLEKYSQCQKYLIPKAVYSQTIEDLKNAAEVPKTKSHHNYYILNRYEVLQCGDVEKLIKKRKSPEDRPVYFATIEDTYDIITKAHIATGHGGRDRMLKHLGQKYANITTYAVELFKSYCLVCQEKRKRPMTKGVVVKPILSKEFNSRCQVDLVDMQSAQQGQFKWIMVYQCHLTKFVVLRPLASKRAAEVAFQLLDIFLLIGAPAILQSDNGSEFTAQVITELKELWPELIMVHGKPRHPQSQGSVERANGDIKDILVAWMSDNDTRDWTVGLKFVQQKKNCAYHAGIKQTPYKAMFGEDPRIGLTSSSLPHEILERLQTEDDLLALHQPSPTANLESASVEASVLPSASNEPRSLPSATSVPPSATTQHQPATIEPPAATSEPSPATSQPTLATSEPSPATSEPSHATSQPPLANSQPPLATSEPSPATSQPPLATSEPSPATSQPPLATSEPSPATSKPPLATSEPSPATSQAPLATSEPSHATSQPPLAPSEPSHATSQPPLATSEPSPATSQPPPATSEPSPATSQPPLATSELSPTTSQPPPANYELPPTPATSQPPLSATSQPSSHTSTIQPSSSFQAPLTPSTPLDKRLQDISNQRKSAREAQLIQAERMVKRARIDLKVGEAGDNVAVPIPMVDRGRGDPRNILGVILDRDENDMYRIAVKAGILTTKFSRNQFDLCPQRLLNDSDVNTEYTVTLRRALKSSASGGQGFFPL